MPLELLNHMITLMINWTYKECWAVFLRNLDDGSKKLSTTSQTPANQLFRARALVEENKISFNRVKCTFLMCRAPMHDVRVVSLYPIRKNVVVQQGVAMCYHIGSKAHCLGAQKPDYLKKETLYSFERRHFPRTIKNLNENDQELANIMHDIREEHKMGS